MKKEKDQELMTTKSQLKLSFETAGYTVKFNKKNKDGVTTMIAQLGAGLLPYQLIVIPFIPLREE